MFISDIIRETDEETINMSMLTREMKITEKLKLRDKARTVWKSIRILHALIKGTVLIFIQNYCY